MHPATAVQRLSERHQAKHLIDCLGVDWIVRPERLGKLHFCGVVDAMLCLDKQH